MHRLRFGLTALFVFAASCRNGGTEDLLADLGLSDAEASCLTREYEAFGLDIATVLRADNETDLTADDVDALREVNQYCAGVGSDATAAPSTREPDEETDRESDAAESAPPEQTFLNDAYGDDPYLDSLYDACADGDLVACDDLYWSTPPGSEYETFAASCGSTDERFLAGNCVAGVEQLWAYGDDAYLDSLYDACAAGSTLTCDTLYWSSAPDSEYNDFAASCGETIETFSAGNCSSGLQATAYGDDPYLDSLYDACADGDMLACDDLYGWAPFGSDYEAFARICGGRRTEAWVEACVTEFGSG